MDWTNLVYLLAAILFILGLKGLTHPRTAVRGNLLGALGMLVAVVWTLIHFEVIGITAVLVGLVLGAAIGAVLAIKIEMTAMPQLVALFNGFGGLASVLVAGAAAVSAPDGASFDFSIALAASGVIGAVTFSGSLIAFGKLQELAIFKRSLGFSGQQAANTLLAVATLALGAWMIAGGSLWLFVPMVLLVIIAMPALLIPPPPSSEKRPSAELPLRVLLVTISVPLL